jgi:ketosteroid isomerase-like protein
VENAEIIRSFYDAHSSGDLLGAEQLMDPEFEFVPSSASHFSAPVHGPKAFNRGLAELIEQFDTFEPVPEKIIDAGADQFVVALHRTARSHGVQLEDRVAHVITMRGGRITRIMGFVTLGEALDAAGLSE